jgi:ParB-like chromosome segregation protein Spo0J
MTINRKIEKIEPPAIDICNRKRRIDPDSVGRIADSMQKIGLRTPISVRYYEQRPSFCPGETDDAFVLLTGAHRLEAAKRLGWNEIECFVYYDGDEVDAELWEIAENLHRAELTALERDEQVARWIELSGVSVQSAPKIGRPESGINLASRDLGIESTDAKRAVKVASLSHEAKQTARELHLDDNRSALLGAARHENPEAQVNYLRSKSEQIPRSDAQVVEDQYRGVVKAWDKACAEARQRFRDYIDVPVMDQRLRT